MVAFWLDKVSNNFAGPPTAHRAQGNFPKPTEATRKSFQRREQVPKGPIRVSAGSTRHAALAKL